MPDRGADRQGRLTIFLGMAPGVGKTVRMLQDGHAAQDEGRDVVVGLVRGVDRRLHPAHDRGHQIDARGEQEFAVVPVPDDPDEQVVEWGSR